MYYSWVMKHEEFCIIYSGNIIQADFLKCILEGTGIEAFLQDEFLGTIAAPYISPGGVGAVKVLVSKTDAEQARAMADDLIRAADARKERSHLRLVGRNKE